MVAQRAGQQPHQRRRALHDVGVQERRRGVEVAVEEAAQRDVVGLLRGAEVGVERDAGAGLELLEERAVVLAVGPDVDRLRVALEEHPVAGVQRGRGRARPRRWCRAGRRSARRPRASGTTTAPVSKRKPSRSSCRRVRRARRSSPARSTLWPREASRRGGGQPGDAAADDHDAARAGPAALERAVERPGTQGRHERPRARSRRRCAASPGRGPARGCGGSRWPGWRAAARRARRTVAWASPHGAAAARGQGGDDRGVRGARSASMSSRIRSRSVSLKCSASTPGSRGGRGCRCPRRGRAGS